VCEGFCPAHFLEKRFQGKTPITDKAPYDTEETLQDCKKGFAMNDMIPPDRTVKNKLSCPGVLLCHRKRNIR
jgi:hypothetical protein